jgi:hemolysin activation/secretion protein
MTSQVASGLSARLAAGLLCALLWVPGHSALAAPPAVPRPDAGSLLNQTTPPGVEPTLPASTLPALLDEEAGEADVAGVRIKVSKFVIDDAKELPADQLEALLSDLVGQELTLSGLRKAAARITQTYRERGYFLARAYLPAQDIADGVVHIAVLEGRYDGVEARGSPRLDQKHVQGVLDAHQVSEGQSVMRLQLERSLILLEQRTGSPAQALLQPGATVGTSHMVLEAPSGPLFSGQLGADNFGNRYSGEGRATAQFSVNSPRGVGDRASVWLMRSSDSDAVFAAYQTPVGYDGFTLGASFSRFNYKLCCEFEPLDETGYATVAGIQARYPLILTQRAIMNAGLSLERKHLVDDSAAGQLDDKFANVAAFTLDGIAAGLRGQNRYQVSLVAGDLNLSDNPGYAAQDAATLDSAGHYLKLRGEFEHLHPFANGHQLDIRLSGQTSNRNLDSSEDFILGGNAGIRAYPEGEAAGDEALLLRLDWIIPLNFSQLPGALTARLFFDTGAIWINEDTRGGLADPGGPNHYGLSGAGFGFNWALPKGFTANLDAATMIGSNPGRSANGDNADGRDLRSRVWLGVNWAF